MGDSSHLPDIAILGGGDPLGESVLRLLAEADFEVGRIHPLSLEETDATVEFGEETLPVVLADGFDWTGVQFVLLANRAAAAARHVESALRAGCRVLGLWDDDIAPIGLTRVPSAPAQALSRLAGILDRAAGLDSLDAVVHLPVSMAGRAAVEELSGQTRALFAMESLEIEVFPVQIAFNMLPLSGPYLDGNVDRHEQAIARDIQSERAGDDLPVIVSACWVPVFYGLSISLHGRVNKELESAALRAALAAAEGVTVMDEPVAGGVPTPATDALESGDIFVGRIRVDARHPRHFSLWLVMDGLQLEAQRIIDSLENLIEISGNSMLT